ncbi:MAG: hypothetical protein ACE15B_22515, partial [Bryobacteraceae bacterium]
NHFWTGLSSLRPTSLSKTTARRLRHLSKAQQPAGPDSTLARVFARATANPLRTFEKNYRRMARIPLLAVARGSFVTDPYSEGLDFLYHTETLPATAGRPRDLRNLATSPEYQIRRALASNRNRNFLCGKEHRQNRYN